TFFGGKVKAQSVALLVIFALATVVLVADASTKSLRWAPKRSAAIDQAPANNVQLIIDDKGLQETVEHQVVSFAPWSAVKSYVQLEKIWAFNLAGGYTAIVPAHAMADAGSTTRGELEAELKVRSIPRLVRALAE
ncbi:hypothetical protein J7E70_22180, partial [Variovorax paradoxus]